MGSGFSKMKKQAKLLQTQLAQAQEELQKKVVEGTSGNGLIKLKINGSKELLKISIKPECIDKDDIEGLQDLIIAAHNAAIEKLGDSVEQSNLPFHF